MAEDDMFITSEEGLPHRCVEVVYMTTLLRDGYGFPEHSRNVTYALEADGMEVRQVPYTFVTSVVALELVFSTPIPMLQPSRTWLTRFRNVKNLDHLVYTYKPGNSSDSPPSCVDAMHTGTTVHGTLLPRTVNK